MSIDTLDCLSVNISINTRWISWPILSRHWSSSCRDTWSTLGQQLVDSQQNVNQLIYRSTLNAYLHKLVNSWLIISRGVDRVSTEVLIECQWSISWGSIKGVDWHTHDLTKLMMSLFHIYLFIYFLFLMWLTLLLRTFPPSLWHSITAS